MSQLERGTRAAHAALRDPIEQAVRAGAPGGRRITTDLGPVYLKFGPLRGSAALHYGTRARLGLATPRIREFDNLAWLRATGFIAPEPIAAGVRLRGPRADFQFLATRELRGWLTLRAFLADSGEDRRARRSEILAEVGRRVARLHATGFVHRDLFPRNLLVTLSGPPTVAFLDAWRGGPRWQPPGRRIAFDLACLLLYLPTLASEDEQGLLLEHYRCSAGFPGDAAGEQRWRRLRKRALRARAHLLDSMRRRGRSSPPLPAH